MQPSATLIQGGNVTPRYENDNNCLALDTVHRVVKEKAQ